MPTRSVELVKHPIRVRTLEIRAIKRPGPLYQLLTLAGDDLADFRTLSPTDHVGLVPPTEHGLVLPDHALMEHFIQTQYFFPLPFH